MECTLGTDVAEPVWGRSRAGLPRWYWVNPGHLEVFTKLVLNEPQAHRNVYTNCTKDFHLFTPVVFLGLNEPWTLRNVYQIGTEWTTGS